MKKGPYTLPLIMIISFTICVSLFIIFATTGSTLSADEIDETKTKYNQLKAIIDKKESYVLNLSDKERALLNYKDLWTTLSGQQMSPLNVKHVLNRSAAERDLMLNELRSQTEEPKGTISYEIIGEYKTIFEWLNATENKFPFIKVVRSQWENQRNDFVRLVLNLEVFTPDASIPVIEKNS